MGRRLALLATAAVLGAIPLAAPAPAHALDCRGAEWVNEKDADVAHVLLGRVVDTRDERLRVAVTETWRGDRLPERVWVGLHEDTFWYTFSDRRGHVPDGYSSPQPWVMALDEDGVLGLCGYWTPTPSVRRELEPAQPLPPLTENPAPDDPVDSPDPVAAPVTETPAQPAALPGPAVAAAVVVPLGLAVGAGWWWRRRRSSGAGG